ncbi:phage major tail tube protein [Tumebacillus permanentifrigoris]|uniref:Phage tail tube protein FII n=1 Tax=Tumebacillus permanentifrigoris TaxID=378543 RepID=A0A316DHI7_9BACL|nr:phage major tail tube protein [Tumebacillus permanentifrigoris]PWK16063.1 hypothetical protein C7459_102310 [Tumebacillus permanentifrigoris]
MKQISEKLINYSVYRNGTEFLGTSDVTLPDLESLSETVKGAGIAGEVESPTLGHFGSMTVSLNWRTLDAPNFRLAQQKSHALDFRGSIQTYDTGAGEYKPVGVKVSVRGTPKKTSLGKLEVGGTMDTSNELEVTYIKVLIDNKIVLELDKFNFICVIDGVDVLKDVREQLGM